MKENIKRLNVSDLQILFDVLEKNDYTVIGPTVQSNAIVYDEIDSVEELPQGYQDVQEAGKYTLKQTDSSVYFGYTVSPQSWKRYLHPPTFTLFSTHREGNTFSISEGDLNSPAYAFIGVRACELNAIRIQDRVFLGGDIIDPIYQRRREQSFIVAVNCTQAGNTCFCASMNTGPRSIDTYDLALTEMLTDDDHYFLVEVGSDKGQIILDQLPVQDAPQNADDLINVQINETISQMGRHLNTENLSELLQDNIENPYWDEIASRCLTCGNCTMVCPTCFCTTVEDITDLTGDSAERVRQWDSCFTMDFSYIHGGSVRDTNKSRYRQWMTHKLSTWQDQFGSLGCVGCGRCITWCPVGIDLVAEAEAIREKSVSVLPEMERAE